MQRSACAATAKLDGAVSCLSAVEGPAPVLALTDAATLYCLDPRVRRGVVHSLKPGAHCSSTAVRLWCADSDKLRGMFKSAA